MKEFFKKQWLNFKKNWYWYILFFAVFSISINCFKFSLFYFCLHFNYDAFIVYDGIPFLASLTSQLYYLPVSICFCYFSFRLNSLSLYIFSYHVYTGKNNWYKFSREREKLHKKEDRLAYEEYLKNQKEDKK